MTLQFRRLGGFTLLELLTVMVIIAVLAALILHGVAYAQRKAAASRANAEIHALSVGLESFKADSGEYPTNGATDALIPTEVKPSNNAYKAAGLYVTAYICAGRCINPATAERDPKTGEIIDPNVRAFFKWKVYAEVPDSSLSTDFTSVTLSNPNSNGDLDPITVSIRYLVDPFGIAYGYSTAGTFNPKDSSFDLWSAGGTTDATDDSQLKWIKNW